MSRTSTATGESAVGELLREWRERRRLSQLDLALHAEISTRHLSFVETGRSAPSREMVLRLAEQLDVPLRERNALLLAAGYAPVYPEAVAGRARAGRRARGDPPAADGARAVPGRGGRPPLEPGRGQRRDRPLLDGVRARSAGAAGERAAGQPAPATGWRPGS